MYKRILVSIIILGGILLIFNTLNSTGLRSVFIHKTKFKDSDYARYAYKLAPGTMGNGAKAALDGFTFRQKQLPNGSIEAEFIPHRAWYHHYKIIVKPGYTLYFLEHDDDSTSTFEKFLNDDHPFLVDPEGYIVN